MPSNIKIALITIDEETAKRLGSGLTDRGYHVSHLPVITGLLGDFYSDPPDLLIVDLASDSKIAESIVHALRTDVFFSTIPIIGLMDCSAGCIGDRIDWQRYPVDDFVAKPVNIDELQCRIFLSQSRIRRIFDNNPLTRLPGNTSIQRAIQEAMGKPMVVCYLDINNFKSYNDVFGFSRGDEVLRMLARIMFNTVRDCGGGFCGHIGGDDFVCIVPAEKAEQICQTIISHYEQVILDLFDETTKVQGYYVGFNRKGESERFPLLTLSIAVVPTDSPRVAHAAKVVEVAAELKAFAKASPSSRYVIDNRRN